MKRNTAIIFSIALALVSLGVVACNTEAVAQSGGSTPPPAATVATPVVRPVAVTRTIPAQVEAIERVDLRARVSGAIESLHFNEGSRVAKGQLLFRIDPRPFAARLAEAEAALAQAIADADAAERENQRSGRLAERRAVSKEQAERRHAASVIASARVDAAKAAVDRARLDLSFTEVRSPITGHIGRAEITRGNLVGPESRLAVIVATDPVYILFDVDENSLGTGNSRFSEWSVSFTTTSGMTHSAEIAFTDNEIGQGTGTLRVRARLVNPDGSMIPGMYGTASLTIGEDPDAVLIREDAISADQGQRFVLVAGADDVLEYRSITLGARHGDLRVVTSGLSATDRVVVEGLMRLRPGMPVTPSVTPMEKAS